MTNWGDTLSQYVLKNNTQKILFPLQVSKFLSNTSMLDNTSCSQFLSIVFFVVANNYLHF